MTLDDTSARLSQVIGGKSAQAIEKALGLTSVGELLRHYPRRYAARGELTDMRTLVDGEAVTLLAEVVSVTSRPMQQRRGTIVEVVVSDGTERISLTFFNQRWREGTFRTGRRGLFAGVVSTYRGRRQLTHPSFDFLPDDVDEDPERVASFAGAFIPIYPATSALSSMQIARAVGVILDTLGPLPDPIPEAVRSEHGLIGLTQALQGIHRPADQPDIDHARARLRFEEAFLLQTVLAQRRAELAHLPARARVEQAGPLLREFDARLPFALTAGQREVGDEIAADLAGDHPMHRLLQGDVGSGKTVVAVRAMLSVVDSGGQAALLAPTEVLAQQHHRSITALLGPMAEGGMLGGHDRGTQVALVTGSTKAAQRRRDLLRVVSGDAGIVIGTHALLTDTVTFNDLGLVVVDEQHRFGVEQRAALASKAADGTRPHVLVMTATPIPRTVAMTVFGDLEVSTLAGLPAGRAGVETHVVPVAERPAHVARAWERVREEVSAGHRVFIVCPRIGDDGVEDAPLVEDEPERRAAAAVLDTVEQLGAGPLQGLRIGMLHGRMPADAKDASMSAFADPAAEAPIEVLVATTVVEVGVDVPSATVMVVLDADRFGISQLHQLRGRVGRGSLPGLCLLFTEALPGSPARERLDAVASTTDGFALAQLDLLQRREGDVLGASQSGRRSSLRLLQVVTDIEVIEQARAAAIAVVDADPALDDHPALRAALLELVAEDQAEFLEKA
ncbi:MAG: ATP-dependent DNA helicase RecG [Candidatus Nanopelagicales bacterium]|nr:ATP-dependent DNA helicase RecG [Candidatus Nanopelagicales bacterium]